tara:strand:- start:12437 stop:13504 length:1068 start_codon:yes stop_codon:yes gene_type:complete
MGFFDIFSKPTVKWLNYQKSARAMQLSDFERIKYELRPCDVLLVEGRTRVSDVIRWITNSPWTHAALYVGRLNDIVDPDLRKIVQHHYQGDRDDRLIIESLLGFGTVVNNLDNYHADHLRICRPSRLGMKDAQQVIRYAISRLGIDYDVRQIFDLARFMFPWFLLPRRWRSTLFQQNPGKSTRTVCSTMIAEAFAFVQFPILPLVKQTDDEKVQLFRRNPRLCVPSDFDYSPYFKIIKYPFVDIDHRNDPHLLPWHTSGDLDRNEVDLYLQGELSPSEADVDAAIQEAIAGTEVTDAIPKNTPENEPESAISPEASEIEELPAEQNLLKAKSEAKSDVKGVGKGDGDTLSNPRIH